MVSTATDNPLAKAAGKGNKDNGEAGTAKQAAARKSPAGKKTSRQKTESRNRKADGAGTEKSRKKPAGAGNQAAGKPRRKVQPAARKTARTKKDTQQTGGQEADAASVEADAVTANDAGKSGDNSRSIAWMSAQAVSALNAVKASQARKAESLLAQVEKPVPGRPGITELPEQTSEDLLEEVPELAAAAPTAAQVTPQETTTSSLAAGGNTPTNQKEATVMQQKPGKEEIPAAQAAGKTTDNAAAEVPATTVVNASPEPEATASTETVIAAQAQSRGLPARPIVMTVFLAMLAYSGYQYWQDKRESHVPATQVTDSLSEGIQGAAWDDIPRQEAISVVGATPGEQSTPAATTPAEVTKAPLPSDAVPAEGIATTTATEPPGSAVAGNSGVDLAQPAVRAEMVTPEPAEVPAGELSEPAEITASEASEPGEATVGEPQQPQTATVAAPPARPAQPQPRYGAPGYGYYPQQRNWQQQPYYQPARPPQYPSR